MIKYDYRNADEKIIGSENGLNIAHEFEQYKDKIRDIIASLNQSQNQ